MTDTFVVVRLGNHLAHKKKKSHILGTLEEENRTMHLTLHSTTSIKSIKNHGYILDMCGKKYTRKYTFTSMQSKLILCCFGFTVAVENLLFG